MSAETVDFTSAFLRATVDSPEFRQASTIINACSQGRKWLIGGFVFRNIARVLYGVPCQGIDLDFIVEEPQTLACPPSWRVSQNSYGNPKLIGPNFNIDFIPLTNISFIKQRKLSPTFENFLTGTPLTVQSIAYDMVERRVVGNIGITALSSRTVAINNQEQAELSAQLRGVTVKQLVDRMATSLSFQAL
jgi:hypothetical protein